MPWWRSLCCAGVVTEQSQEANGSSHCLKRGVTDLTVQVSVGSDSSAKAYSHAPAACIAEREDEPGHLKCVTQAQLDLLPHPAALYAIDVTRPWSPVRPAAGHCGSSLQRWNSEPVTDLSGAWVAVSSGSHLVGHAAASTQEHLLVNEAGLELVKGKEAYMELLQAHCSQDNLLAAIINDLHRASLAGGSICCSHTLHDFLLQPGAGQRRMALKVHSCTFQGPSGRPCPALLFLHGHQLPHGAHATPMDAFGFALNHISEAVTVFSAEGAVLFQNAESVNQLGHLGHSVGACMPSPHTTPSICEQEALLLQPDSPLGSLFAHEGAKLRDMLECMREKREWSSIVRIARPRAAPLAPAAGIVAACAYNTTERRRSTIDAAWPLSRRPTKLQTDPLDLLMEPEWQGSSSMNMQGSAAAERGEASDCEDGSWTIPAVAATVASGVTRTDGSTAQPQLVCADGCSGLACGSCGGACRVQDPADADFDALDRASSDSSWCSEAAAAYLSGSATHYGFGGAAAVSPTEASAAVATAASASATATANAAAPAAAEMQVLGLAAPADEPAGHTVLPRRTLGTASQLRLLTRTDSCPPPSSAQLPLMSHQQQRRQWRASASQHALAQQQVLPSSVAVQPHAVQAAAGQIAAAVQPACAAPALAAAAQAAQHAVHRAFPSQLAAVQAPLTPQQLASAAVCAPALQTQAGSQESQPSGVPAAPAAATAHAADGHEEAGSAQQALNLNRCGSMARCASGWGAERAMSIWCSTEVPTPARSCSLQLGSRPGSMTADSAVAAAAAVAGATTHLPPHAEDSVATVAGPDIAAVTSRDAAAASHTAPEPVAAAGVALTAQVAAVPAAAVTAVRTWPASDSAAAKQILGQQLQAFGSSWRPALEAEDSGTSGTCSSAFAPAAQLGFDDDQGLGSRSITGLPITSESSLTGFAGTLLRRLSSSKEAMRQLSVEFGSGALAADVGALAALVKQGQQHAAQATEPYACQQPPQQQQQQQQPQGLAQAWQGVQQAKRQQLLQQQGRVGSPATLVARCSSDPPPLYHMTLAPAIPRSVRAFSTCIFEAGASNCFATAVWPPAATAIASAATRASAFGNWSLPPSLLTATSATAGAVATAAAAAAAASQPRLLASYSFGSHSARSASSGGLGAQGIGELGLGGGAFTPVRPSTGASWADSHGNTSRRSLATPTPNSPLANSPCLFSASSMFSPSSRLLLAGCESVQRAPVLRTTNSWPRHTSESGNAFVGVPGKGVASKLLAIRQRTSEVQQQQQPPAHGPAAGPSDSLAWHQLRAQPIVDPVSHQDAILLIQQDVTERVEAESALHDLVEAQHSLLESVFPRHIIEVMAICNSSSSANAGPGVAGIGARSLDKLQQLASWHPQVSVLFADICGFTAMCKEVAPSVVMSFLNDLYSRFDTLLDIYGVYKVETIGDCYMVAGGLVKKDADGFKSVMAGQVDPLNALRVMDFAKAMLCEARKVMMPTTGQPVLLRVGIHTGPVTSGVVGTRMPRFCLFGDTINMASRMESTAAPGCIHASLDTKTLLAKERWVPTGGVDVKGKGLCESFIWQALDGAASGPDRLRSQERDAAAAAAPSPIGRASLDHVAGYSGGNGGRRLRYGGTAAGEKVGEEQEPDRRSSCDIF